MNQAPLKLALAKKLEMLRCDAQGTNAIIASLPIDLDAYISENIARPLFGKICVVKDSLAIAGQPLTFGLKSPVIAACEHDAAIVTRLRALGALVAARANMDPAGLDCLGDNPAWGAVKNPNFPDLISGGSSSGSAAAVAAGYCDFAIGTDMGGSIRIPAACCGIWGLKTESFSLPRAGGILLPGHCDAIGFLARDFATLKILSQLLLPENQRLCRRLLVPTQDMDDMSSEIKEQFTQALKELSQKFEIIELAEELGLKQLSVARTHLVALAFRELVSDQAVALNNLPPAGHALLRLAETLTNKQRSQAEGLALSVGQTVRKLLRDDGLILTPTLPTSVPRSGEAMPQRAARLNRYLELANVCDLPAMAMPFSAGFSLQIIGHPKFAE